MQGIEFEEDKDFSGLKAKAIEPTVTRQGFIMKFLEKGGISDKTTGNFILLGISMIFFGVAIFLYAGLFGKNIPSKENTQQITAQLRVLKEMQRIK